MKTENLNHYGWICPKCGKALAPWIPYCTCDTVDKDIKCCGICEFTDGHCCPSNPARVKCTKTGEYHFYTHVCDLGKERTVLENA